MRCEPIEFSLAKNAARTRRAVRLDERLRADSPATDQLPAADALDQAFADFSRVDVGTSQVDALRGHANGDHRTICDPRSMTKELVADIAMQLNVLDRQREQLAALIRSVDVSSVTRSSRTR